MNALRLAPDDLTLDAALRVILERGSLELVQVAYGELLAADDPPLWMYAIQAGGRDGPIKIGITRDPRHRMSRLQGSNPLRLELLAAWRTLAIEERRVHAEFADLRIRGEWFEPHWTLLRHVALFGASRWRW